MTLVLLAALGAVVVGFVLYPVLRAQVPLAEHPAERAEELERLAEEKTRILAAIKDLDFEYKAGKLSDPDYQRVRTEDLGRAARVMARMEALTSGAREVSRQQENEPEETSEITCPSCRQANPAHAKFCLRCGNPFERKTECPKCGTELPRDARFCISCGEAIRS
jgi:hypothetical protein